MLVLATAHYYMPIIAVASIVTACTCLAHSAVAVLASKYPRSHNAARHVAPQRALVHVLHHASGVFKEMG